jgi:16S rRNA (cytidine1402-2'-O)-methyltransferase
MMSPGKLFIVATPIGNLADLSPRAQQTLAEVALIAAEDTRHSQQLLAHLGLRRPMLSLHEHNETARAQQLVARLQQGDSIALISDAGTPLISDPGYALVTQVRAAGIEVVPIPGPCALIAALSASGLPTDRFVFEGFLAAKTSQRQQRLQQLQTETRTLVCYESTHRILASLADIALVFGPERQMVLAKELTKSYERLEAGTVTEIMAWLQQDPLRQKGEFVLVLAGQPEVAKTQDLPDEAMRILRILLNDLPLKQAASLAAEITGLRRKQLYDWAVAQKDTPSEAS